jgi:hypothetical protein
MNRLSTLAPVAALAGGLGLLLHYALHLAHGLRTGGLLWDAMATPMGRVDGVVFTLAFGAIDLALLGVFARLDGRAPALGRAGAGFATLALAAVAAGLFSFLAGSMLPVVMPVAVLAMFVGALLLGIAGLRTRALPRGAGAALIGFALLTAPLGFGVEALGKLAGWPAYVGFELHFVVAALVWLGLAGALRAEARQVRPALAVA